MRILYGVVGEGMGHAIRSSVVLEGLVERGHDVRIAASGRAADFLAARYPQRIIRITGLSLVYRDNMVSVIRSAGQNLKAVGGLPQNFRRYLETARDYHPDVVISDFESWTYWFARGMNIPVISIDNMQIISRCRLDDDVTATDRTVYLVTKGIVRAKLPKCNAYMISTFFFPDLAMDRTCLYPPILRRAVLDRKKSTTVGDHLLVYQTGTSHQELVSELKSTGLPCRVYGLRRDLREDQQDENLLFRPFSEVQFLDDLASCSAVVSGGSFTLMGEAIHLHKPMLSVPMRRQFEQILNARYLAKQGLGAWSPHVRRDDVLELHGRAAEYRTALHKVTHDDNRGFFADLERALTSAVDEGALSP